MTVGSNQHETRTGEALQVQIVANTTAGRRVNQPIACAYALKVAVIVLIFPVQLEYIVVHVLDGERYRNPIDFKCLELETSHRARVVLQQNLVHSQLEFITRRERSTGQVSTEKLCDQGLCHANGSFLSANLSIFPGAFSA
jgi:hypothetical protein